MIAQIYQLTSYTFYELLIIDVRSKKNSDSAFCPIRLICDTTKLFFLCEIIKLFLVVYGFLIRTIMNETQKGHERGKIIVLSNFICYGS